MFHKEAKHSATDIKGTFSSATGSKPSKTHFVPVAGCLNQTIRIKKLLCGVLSSEHIAVYKIWFHASLKVAASVSICGCGVIDSR